MSDLNTNLPPSEDNFEIGLRIFGQEILAMTLKSQSKARNWIVLSMICIAILFVLISEFGPGLKETMGI